MADRGWVPLEHLPIAPTAAFGEARSSPKRFATLAKAKPNVGSAESSRSLSCPHPRLGGNRRSTPSRLGVKRRLMDLPMAWRSGYPTDPHRCSRFVAHESPAKGLPDAGQQHPHVRYVFERYPNGLNRLGIPEPVDPIHACQVSFNYENGNPTFSTEEPRSPHAAAVLHTQANALVDAECIAAPRARLAGAVVLFVITRPEVRHVLYRSGRYDSAFGETTVGPALGIFMLADSDDHANRLLRLGIGVPSRRDVDVSILHGLNGRGEQVTSRKPHMIGLPGWRPTAGLLQCGLNGGKSEVARCEYAICLRLGVQGTVKLTGALRRLEQRRCRFEHPRQRRSMGLFRWLVREALPKIAVENGGPNLKQKMGAPL